MSLSAAAADRLLLHLETTSSLFRNTSNQTNMAHALDTLKARLGPVAVNRSVNSEPGCPLQWSDIFRVRWAHLTLPEQNLLNRLSVFLRSTISPPSLHTLPYDLSGQDLLFVWLTQTEPLDTLTFKWKTVENLQWRDLTAAEQACFDGASGEIMTHLLSMPIWHVPALMAPYSCVRLAFGLIPRPFPANFRNTSNAKG
jgi:hypothetical protein